MSLLKSLFGPRKKAFRASCQITREPLENGYGYLLTTAQVVASPQYWDLVMTEPETLSYTVSHFNNKPAGTKMRSLIFDKYATVGKPWIVSDSVISYFDIDRDRARESARRRWESEGSYQPEATGPAHAHLNESTFNVLRDYAILEVGRHRMRPAKVS